ncbi:hypothetical protein J3R83DRAFT_11648 [Lanmaoa asiatica]|nr:hypothetical protein J3R83DRAFT_11648 [Lanmaoa asiatica]
MVRLYRRVTCSIVARDSPRSIDEPSQPTQTNGLPSVNEDDQGSRASLDASVAQVHERPRVVIIHQDGGHIPQVDGDEPIELPPPYTSILPA